MTWKELLIGIPLAVIGAVLLLATGAGMMFTRTNWGREQVRSYALEKLNGSVQGRVEIDEVLEGDLLRMVRMAGVRIYEPDGREFAQIDTLSVHYRWADFLFGNVTLARVTLVGPVAQFRVEPESGWNFLRVFAGKESGSEGEGEAGRGPRVVLREVAIRSGDISLRTPWEPDPGFEPDSSRWYLERTADGWERVIRLERLDATFPTARVAGPSDQARLFQIAELSSHATIIGEPVEIEQLRADIEVIGDTLSFQLWQADLPDSHVFGQGWVTLRSDPDYEFTLRGNPVTTRDLTWLIPQLPPGVAHLDFHFLSHRDQIALEARNARWESPEAGAAGDFAITLSDGPDGLRFNRVDLEVQRVHSSLIESLTGWRSPVVADLSGDIVLDGPLSALQVGGDVVIDPEGAEEPSHIVARGMLYAEPGALGARDLAVQLDGLQLDLVRAFVPGLAVLGDVTGVADLDGRLPNGLRVDLEVEQRDRDFAPIRLSGGGTITKPSGAPLRLDVDVSVDTVSLATLAEYYPAIPVRGSFRGRIQALGPLSDLRVDARLAGVSDSLHFAGNLQLARRRPAYRGEVQGWRMSLPEFRRGIPASDIDFELSLQGEGVALTDIEASGQASVFASFVGGVRFDSASAALRVSGGKLVVDTSVASGEFGELRASGALSLVQQESDSLRFELDADSLGALSPWFFPDIEALAGPGRLTPTGAAPARARSSSVEGAAHVEGWLVRDAGRFALRGGARGQALTYTDFSADSFWVEGFDVGTANSGTVARGELEAVGANLAGLRFDELRLAGEHVGSRTSVDFQLAKERAAVSGSLWSDKEKEIRTFGLDSMTARLGRSVWELENPALFQYDEAAGLTVRDLEFRSAAGQALLDGFVSDSGPISLRARVTGVQLANIAALWQDTTEMAGLIELEVELIGLGENPTLRGQYEVVDGRLLGVDFSRLGGTMSYDGLELALDASLWRGEALMASLRGTLPVDMDLPEFGLSLPDRPLDLTLDGDSVPLVLARVVTDQIADVGGYARASVTFGGAPGDLSLGGTAELADGRFRVIWSGIRYTGLRGGLTFEGKNVRLDDLVFSSVEGGRGTARGIVAFTSLTNPEFVLRVTAQSLPVYDRLDARAVVSGAVTLGGAYEAPIVAGDLSVVSGVLFVEEVGRQREIIDPFESGTSLLDEIIGPFAAQRPATSPFMENLTMDLNLAVAQDTWLRSAEMNVEIAGDLIVQMRPRQEEWRIDGTLAAVRGDYRLFNKRFEVIEGTIDFVGMGMNPGLRIVSLYTVQTQKQPIIIRLVIGGTLEAMTLSLQSDHRPPIPESDLLSYLLFGRPAFELTRTGAERSLVDDVTSGVPQAFVGYALSSLLVGEAGIAYVDVSRVNPLPDSEAEGEYRSGVGPALAATQVEVGWYLAPTVFVSVAQHLVGAVRPTVRLDWRLDEKLTLRGITEPRFGREGVLFYGGPGSSDLEQSIGLFLFYGWSY